MTLALYRRGLFTWPEWAAALSEEIKRAQAALKQCDVIVRIEKGRLAAIESTAGTQLVAVVESKQ